jgi:hypothetical protein
VVLDIIVGVVALCFLVECFLSTSGCNKQLCCRRRGLWLTKLLWMIDP